MRWKKLIMSPGTYIAEYWIRKKPSDDYYISVPYGLLCNRCKAVALRKEKEAMAIVWSLLFWFLLFFVGYLVGK